MMLLVSALVISVAPRLTRPVAVMVHGAGGGGWEYRTWKKAYEKVGYKVIARNLVPSKGGLAKTTFQDYVDQVVLAGGKRPDVLVGASMGGVIVLKAAEKLQPHCLILVCSAMPLGVGSRKTSHDWPEVVKWANGPYEDTVSSTPDSDEQTRHYAHKRWRDESGTVLNTLSFGVPCAKPSCPVLSVIPENDDTVLPADQQELAGWCKADKFRFFGMSHVGPLLSTRSAEVADATLTWIGQQRKGR